MDKNDSKTNTNEIKAKPKTAKTTSSSLLGLSVGKGRAGKRWNVALSVVLAIILCSGFGFLGGWLAEGSSVGDSLLNGPVKAPEQQRVVTSQSQLFAKIVNEVGPSVVSVDVTSRSQASSLFGFAAPTTQQDAGTGIIISADGLIITNRHVVPSGATSVSITLSDGTTFKNVKVLGRTNQNSSLDIAFLKIQDLKGAKLHPASLGDSSSVKVGDEVLAIGNALGQFQNTVTTGIISGHGRSITAGDDSGTSQENLQDMFQTDAAINPGNSGGPLVNMSGQVIGINTAVAGSAQNIGFSIPINDVKGLIKAVNDNGKLSQPYLGVYYVPLTKDYAYVYNLPIDHGAYIVPSEVSGQPGIAKGSPAATAGLKEKDIITKVNGTEVDQNNSLVSLINQHQPGDTVDFTVRRGSSSIDIKVKLGTMPEQAQAQN